MFKEYSEYLKDNPKGYWFKRKLFGWGWVPATWQGWVVILIFLGLIFWIAIDFSHTVGDDAPSARQLIWFFIQIVSVTLLLIGICWKKGESPKWQWGIPKNK
jgi:hypothetical protein